MAERHRLFSLLSKEAGDEALPCSLDSGRPGRGCDAVAARGRGAGEVLRGAGEGLGAAPAGADDLREPDSRGVQGVQREDLPDRRRAVHDHVADGPGFVTLFAADGTRPLASSINFSPGQTRANNATLPLALDATGFSVFNGSVGTVHFILDVNGYFE